MERKLFIGFEQRKKDYEMEFVKWEKKQIVHGMILKHTNQCVMSFLLVLTNITSPFFVCYHKC